MKSILELIFSSEKRKNMLLLLQDGPMEMPELIEALDTTGQVLLPQAKILTEKHLVRRTDDSYELTTLGRLVVDDMLPLIGTASLLDNGCDYMGTHYLDFIPPHLLKRLRELESCKMIEVPLAQLFDIDEHFFEEAKRTKFLYMVTAFMFPTFGKIFSELAADDVKISVVVSKDLYKKLLHDNSEELQDLLEDRNISFYSYPENFDFVSFSLTDHSILLRLLTQEGNYDNKKIMFSSDSAREWGREFFEHYKTESKEMSKDETPDRRNN